MDISSLYSIGSSAIQTAAENMIEDGRLAKGQTDMFSSLLNTAIDNLNAANAYISDAENEKVRWALGQTDNTHDLTNAMQKAAAVVQYTTAFRDRFLEAYKEIMNMQI